MYRKVLTLALLSTGIFAAKADDIPESIVADIEAGGTITISQPARLDSLLRRPAAIVRTDDGKESSAADHAAATTRSARSGYRVQLFEDNNPRTARNAAQGYHNRVQAEFPQIRSYVSFNSPYWRVKAGDCRTRAEAEAMMAELKQAFPNLAPYMRIVRDKINSFD